MTAGTKTSSAVILAGGLGTRLRSAVPDLPKPMAPISGRPFLEHQIDYWIKQGIGRFVLSVGYRHEVIQAHFGTRYNGAEIDYVIEHTPLGTGGGLLLALEKLDANERFLLLNGDTYFAVDLQPLEQLAAARDADWCFCLFRANEAGRYMGMGVAPDGTITSLKSGSGEPGRLANGGVYLVHPRSLAGGKFAPGDKASLEDDIMPDLIGSARMVGMEFGGAFIDIGVPDDYHRAPQLLAV